VGIVYIPLSFRAFILMSSPMTRRLCKSAQSSCRSTKYSRRLCKSAQSSCRSTKCSSKQQYKSAQLCEFVYTLLSENVCRMRIESNIYVDLIIEMKEDDKL
jgi:hypothetical protein